MVLVFIVYSNAVDDEIVETVKRHAGGYTKFMGLHGEGNGEPHLGSHVWPGVNNCIMVAMDDRALKEIQGDIEELKAKFPGVGIHLMVTGLKKIL
jgi:hypothetical protein